MALPAAASDATAPTALGLDAASDAGVEGADPLAVAEEVVLQRLLAAGEADMALGVLLAEGAAGPDLEPECLREILYWCCEDGPSMAKQKAHRRYRETTVAWLR